jgi:16S rRNA (cytosine967-C5)-methyltransferase
VSASVRTLAARFLAEIIRGEKSLAALPPYPALIPQDRALLQELCFGVCRFYFRHQAMLHDFLPKPLKAKDADVLALLHLGIYQLLHTRVPDHAAIGATVEAAQGLKKPWAKGLVNGVLRNIQRRLPELRQSVTELPNHPSWLMDKVQQAWPDAGQAILSANDQRPPFTLRVNSSRTTREDYLKNLRSLDFTAEPCIFAADGITLAQACPVTELPGFAEAAVSVQDEAAQLAADLLQLTPGLRILDACCAPGGKTCHMLEREPALDEVVALDVEAARMARVEDNLWRLGLTATLKVADATRLTDWWDQVAFDRILLDAPCSATGVIRRHPDIKLLRRANDIDKLADLQRQLLRQLWQTLKPGGLLVYATCSVLPQENEETVAAFIAEQSDVEHIPIDADWGHTRPYGRQLLPRDGGHDGFYYALLRKR